MNKRLMIIFVAAIFAVLVAGPVGAADKTPAELIKEAKASIKEVTVGDVKKMVDAKENVILLDVTDRDEFEKEHIPGAINISRGTLEFKAATAIPDKNARIIIYCGLDRRSALATKSMNDIGYKNALNMIGGLKAWKEAGYPTTK